MRRNFKRINTEMGFDDFIHNVFAGVETVFPGLREERRPNDMRTLLEREEQFQQEFESTRNKIEQEGRCLQIEVDNMFQEVAEAQKQARKNAAARKNICRNRQLPGTGADVNCKRTSWLRMDGAMLQIPQKLKLF